MSSDLNNQEKLEAIYQMTLENNAVLRTIRRQQYFSTALRVLYWLIVLGVLGSVYYFARPLVTGLSENSNRIEETLTQFNQLRGQLPEIKMLNQVINGITPATATPAQ